MNKLSNEELIPFPFQQQAKWYEQQESQTFSRVKLILNEDIKEPFHYNDVLHRIDTLQEGDLLEVYIDTVGGNLDGCIAIIDAIENTAAEVIGFLKNKAYSAGSAIALSCPSLNISPNARMMIHSWHGGFGGKNNEIVSDYEFNTKYLANWFEGVYKHFLTAKEIQEVAQGRDIYLNADEILERLERKNNILQKEIKKTQKADQIAAKKLLQEESA